MFVLAFRQLSADVLHNLSRLQTKSLRSSITIRIRVVFKGDTMVTRRTREKTCNQLPPEDPVDALVEPAPWRLGLFFGDPADQGWLAI